MKTKGKKFGFLKKYFKLFFTSKQQNIHRYEGNQIQLTSNRPYMTSTFTISNLRLLDYSTSS